MRRALVTGASSGIGNAIARALLDDGWDVVGLSRTTPLIRHDHYRHTLADVADGMAMDRVYFRLADAPLDALVHCAAVQGPVGPMETTDPIEWSRSLRTNLTGAYIAVRMALPLLRRSEDGRILLFSGGGAFNPRPNYTAYAAAKGGIVALMESLAAELADSTVTANCVAPGFVPTPIHDRALAAGPELAGAEYDEIQMKTAYDDGTAMRRVLGCVRHLLSHETEGLTGKTVAAQWDDWPGVRSGSVAALNASRVWTRDRVSAVPASVPQFSVVGHD